LVLGLAEVFTKNAEKIESVNFFQKHVLHTVWVDVSLKGFAPRVYPGKKGITPPLGLNCLGSPMNNFRFS
jgi:hypothetical protein